MWLNLFHHCSHGLRTGIFEASKLVLINFAPNLPEIQVIITLYSLFGWFRQDSNFVLQVYVLLCVLIVHGI